MTNKQGSEWERAIANNALGRGIPADRLPKRGIKGEPDVFIGAHPEKAINIIPVVMWKRLVKTGGKRRTPDGVRSVVVIEVDEYLDMLEMIDGLDPEFFDNNCVAVQAKWTERLNVTRTLKGLIDGLGDWLKVW